MHRLQRMLQLQFLPRLPKLQRLGIPLRLQKLHIVFSLRKSATQTILYIQQAIFEKKYETKITELKKLPQEKLFEMLEKEKRKHPHIFMQGYNNENVTGNHISWSKNAHECFNINDAEDCLYIGNGYQIKDCMDCNYTAMGSELNYFCHSAVSLYNSNFCDVCWYSQNLEYCEYVFNSHNCFGCVSLNHASYRILNIQYKPEEYRRRVVDIKAQMKKEGIYGDFFMSNYQKLKSPSLWWDEK